MYKYKKQENCIEIEKDEYFSLEKTFDCGQCFRFVKKDGGFEGVAFNKRLSLFENEKSVFIYGITEEEFLNTFYSFFNLDKDYKKINESIFSLSAEHAAFLKEAESVSRGIRILKQEPFETLCSFIISQNNNIPRIRKIINAMCEAYGEETDGAFSFPSAEKLFLAGEERLYELKMGFRAKYVFDAAKKVYLGEIDLNKIYSMSFFDALSYLTQIKGVGTKVASCVLLFSYNKYDSFPIDVWIQRVIDKYFDGSIPDFGEYKGIFQQYLFYYERYVQNKKG